MTANFYNLNSPTPMIGQSGPLILNNQLQPVWFKPVPTSVVANNLEVQTYDGKPALSYWQGVINNVGATVSGQYVVVNQHYQTDRHAERRRWLGPQPPRLPDLGPRRVGYRLQGGSRSEPDRLRRVWPTAWCSTSPCRNTTSQTGKLLKSWDALEPRRYPQHPALAVPAVGRSGAGPGTRTTSTRSS